MSTIQQPPAEVVASPRKESTEADEAYKNAENALRQVHRRSAVGVSSVLTNPQQPNSSSEHTLVRATRQLNRVALPVEAREGD